MKNNNDISSTEDMRRQWNELANKNAYFAIDSTEEFENASNVDLGKFFQRGENDVERLLRKVEILRPKDKVMLEIGCGYGRMSKAFAKIFSKVYAIDISDEMIKNAKKICSENNIVFIKGNGDDLKGVENNIIDFVFSYIVFQHIIDKEVIFRYIEEMSRVMKTGGIAFFQLRTHIHYTKVTIIQLIKETIKKIIGYKKKDKQKVIYNIQSEKLEEHFSNNYSAWYGSNINILELLPKIKDLNFKILNIENIEDQYTYFTLLKE